jgi:hypothetical protein
MPKPFKMPTRSKFAMRFQSVLISTLALVLVACGGEDRPLEDFGVTGSEASGLDFQTIAQVLAERMNLQPGERVLLVSQPGRFDGLLDRLADDIEARGGVYLGAASVTAQAFTGRHRTDFVGDLASLEPAAVQARFASVDLGIMLPGPTATDPIYAAMQNVLRGNQGRTIHFHWAGAYGLDGVLFAPDPHVDSFYVQSLATTDYAALANRQAAFEDALRTGSTQVTTPAGTDLTFRVGDRPVTKQDGDASRARSEVARNLIDREVELPAGAIRVAPLEETVEGRIVFPPGVWGGESATGVTLVFEAGRAVSIDAEQGPTAVERELDEAGDAGRAFREFALGLNPTLGIPTDEPWIPYYGYGSGVVRLSLGDNTELGGAVGGGYVRWNFFTDATVVVNGDVWVQDGRLVRP